MHGKFRSGRANIPNGVSLAFLYGLIFLVGLLLGAHPASAQEKSFLWKIQSEKSRFYILGSIHFLKKEHYPLKQTIEEAFDSVKKLVLEIDILNLAPEKAQAMTIEKGIFRDGTTLRQNIAEETYVLADERAKELGIDLKALFPLKPWLVALTLTSIKLQKLGFDPNHGIDRYLAARAKDGGKSTEGLETLEFQIGLFDQLSKRDQESLLRQSLDEMHLLDQRVNQIVQSWTRGDILGLEKPLLAGMRQFPEVHRKVIVERNRRWLGQIEKLIAEAVDTMVVVGAGHLVGEDGVIELLKQRGYRVEQM